MARTVQIDFVGMCLLIERMDGSVMMGLIDEPRHLHIMTFRQTLDGKRAAAGGVATALVPLFPDSDLVLTGCDPGVPEVVDPAHLLPDLGSFGAPRGDVLANMAVRIHLPVNGTLEALPAIQDIGPWSFGPSLKGLTDRTRLTTTTTQESITLGVELSPVDDRFEITIIAIDVDASRRRNTFEAGSALCEFDILNRSVGVDAGPIPTLAGIHADPSNPICPQARIKIA